MKWSPYNHMFYSEKHGYLLYNIYSNTFFEFDRKTFSELEKIRESPDDHDYSNSMSLLLQLQSAGILIKDETSPQLELNLNNTVNRFAPRNLALTIAPTRDCNFECPYCYEEDRPSIYMSDETVEKTIRFIKKYRNFNRKNISWYGGEPLLCWDIIQRISDSLLGDDIDFSADIITNGYLLTPEKVRRLDELNIRLIQITLDGMEETHNTRRSPKDTKDSFERIIENMDYLIKNWKGRLSIRINVDRENHEEYHKVYTMLRERYSEYKNRLNIYPGIVKDYSGTCITASSCGLDRIEMQQFMFECYRKYGIKDMNFYPRSTYSSCSAITLHSYVLGPEGELYKCWRDIGRKEMIVGSIDGSIPTNNTLLAKYLVDINPYTSDKCGDCFFLPLCNGGCPNLRYRNKYEGTSFDTCMIHKQDLNGFLETYYEIKKGME